MDLDGRPEITYGSPLATLTFLEIVLGVDNVIFISILSGKLPRRSSRGRAATGCWRRW